MNFQKYIAELPRHEHEKVTAELFGWQPAAYADFILQHPHESPQPPSPQPPSPPPPHTMMRILNGAGVATAERWPHQLKTNSVRGEEMPASPTRNCLHN